MDQNILNKLNDGEQLVEMAECILHDEIVIKAIIYKCHVNIEVKGFWKPEKIERKEFTSYEFPFYFASKEFAQSFIENSGNFVIYSTTYYDGKDYPCYALKLTKYDTHLKYIMVDSFKWKNKYHFDNKCQLQERGVWDGMVNSDGRYYTLVGENLNYKDIFKFENIATETKKTYMFKMIEEK